MSLHFAFLVLEEHPYGREMLRILLENGIIPGIIIQEVSPLGDEEREKFLTRISGQPIPPLLKELAAGGKIPVFCVSNHNGPACRELLEEFKPDLLVLGGTRIIKTSILRIPKHGTINSHPGLLPRLRGSSSVGWALYKDLPQGATTHFVDQEIDTGDIILSRQLPVYHDDTYESLNYRIAILAGELMAASLKSIAVKEAPRTPQDLNAGETLKVIPDDLLEEGRQRLAEGLYSHYADQG